MVGLAKFHLVSNRFQIVQLPASLPVVHSALDQLLAAMDIGVNHFTACDIRRGWAVDFDACSTASLHYCLAGSGVLIANGRSFSLEPHTFVLLPAGVAYRLANAPSPRSRSESRARLAASPARESVPAVVVGKGAPGLSTACGELVVGTPAGADLFGALNAPLVTRFNGTEGLRDQFVMLLAEAAQPRIGSRALTEALLKQCLVLALRRSMQLGDTALPWLVGVADPRLGRALTAIFDQATSPLTVELLATIANMSRSAFAAAFSLAFSCSPMQLVKIVRLRRAGELLATTALPVAEVARRVGFSSRSNFSQAFSQFHGMDPSKFRRIATQPSRRPPR